MKPETEAECIEWARLHMPWLVARKGKRKHESIFPYISDYAFDQVAEAVGRELFKMISNNKKNLTNGEK